MEKRNLHLQKKVLPILLVLLLSAVGMNKGFAYDFSKTCSTGQTLYYNITDATNHYVEITYPATDWEDEPWEGYTKPTGNITLPSSVSYNGTTYVVKAIGWAAFYNCSGLIGSLTIPNSVTTIVGYAFAYCSGFTGSLTIPNSVTSIGYAAFAECSGLIGSLTIPNSVTTIVGYAFAYCSGFTGSLTIPNSVTSIGYDAFYGCSGFTGTLTIGNSVTSIGFEAFDGCSGFTGSLTIPSSVTTIGSDAFNGCTGFTGSLTIGSSVTSIAQDAFSYCTGFSSMMVLPETPPTLGEDAFENVSTSIPVYVPCASLEDYQSASGWSDFTNMQCIPELTVYDGAATNGYVPVYGYYTDAYLKAEFVMPASELADMANGAINSMKFYASQDNVSWGNANFQVFLTEVADATISAFAGPGTVVYQGALSIVGGEMTVDFTTPYQYDGGNLLVGIYNTVKGSFVTSTWYGETVNGASVQGFSYSSLEEITPTQRNFIPKTTFTYTPSECSRPNGLAVTDITTTSARLSWNGYQDSYDVRYRKKPLFFEDFENGLPSDWTTIDNDGDGYDWHSESNYSSSYYHSGNGIMVSASYIYENNTNIALTPDNWLITPLLDLQGTMKVWIRALHPSYAQEHFAIYLSTTGTNVSDFTTVLVPETTLTDAVYRAYTADLSAYEGQQGYIAIRHFNCSDMYEILLDDFGLYDDPSETGDWTMVEDIQGSALILGSIDFDSEFEWQVRGRDCDGEGSYTEWSAANVFTTEALCAPEDKCLLTFTLTDSYGDGWNGAALDVYEAATNILLASLSAPNHGLISTPTTDTYTLAVCDGRELMFWWESGSWDGECSYIVTDVNGNEIFSGTGAMSDPVTYMVDCSPVQTVALSSGWNWFSSYLEITLDDLKSALLAAYPSASANELVIKGYGTGQTAWNPVAQRWIGGLTEMDLSKMYMVKVPAAGEIALDGELVNPADHPCTISNGVNWIAFPLSQSKSVSEAFAGFPANGDVVKGNRSGQATWNSAAQRWIGQLQILEPGQGYIYQSSVAENRVLSFAQFDYVDLGLPSGLLWATCNVGADSPEDYGDYFAWGETTPKDTYNWSTYQYGDGDTFTKYTGSDGLTTLLPEDDAATANWGPDWRMPTKAEWQELFNNTTVTWTQQNGVNGRLFTASNGNSLFLPAAGDRWDDELYYAGDWGNYWSSSLNTDNPYYAWYFGFGSDYYGMTYNYRNDGFSVRPVREN